jgi:hypothetical protein
MALLDKPPKPTPAFWPDDVRVFYDVSAATVEILAIVAKSEAEPWLAQFGSRA